MIFMSLLILLRPAVVSPPTGTLSDESAKHHPHCSGLVIAGFYGGFVQAGVGFLLLASIAGTLRYDIVRANAIKLVCTLVFTLVSLVVFIWQDQVAWFAGFILSLGYVAGLPWRQAHGLRDPITSVVSLRPLCSRRSSLDVVNLLSRVKSVG